MAIKKFKIEASEQAKQLAKKPVKASDGEWDKAVISFIDTIPELPEQGKVISKKYKGFPVVIVGLGDGKCLYNGYTRTNDAASDVQFIRGLIKRGDSPEKATANLGFKTYTRGEVEGACGGKKKSVKAGAEIIRENDTEIVLRDDDGAQLRVVKRPYGYRIRRSMNESENGEFCWDISKEVYDTPEEAKQAALDGTATFTFKGRKYASPIGESCSKESVKSAAGKKRWGLYSDFGQRILNETFDSKREAQKAFREYGYTKDSEAWIEEVDETAVGKFDKKPANSACGGKKTVKSSAKKSVKCAADNADLERAKRNIVDGYNNDNWEYGEKTVEEYFKDEDLNRVPILYTTLGDENEHDYQLYADLINPKIIVEIDGETIYEDKFPNIGALADDLEDFEWDNWYSYYLRYVPDEIVYGDSVESACGGKKTVKAGRDNPNYRPKKKSVKSSKRSRSVKASSADGYDFAFYRDGYRVLTKTENNRGKWLAQKDNEEPFEITYEQARGFEPIDPRNRALQMKLGKALKLPIRSSAVKAAKKDNMNKEAHKWYNISLTKDEYAKFRKFLKENGYKYEPSEEGQNTYVKVYLTKADADKVNKFLDSMDDVESACGGKKSKKIVKASAAAKRRAEKSVKASKYYEITDHYNDEVGRADTEDEARELAKKLVRENDVEYYDIFWVDTDPDSTDDTSYIDTVYADKPFSVEGYFETNFRGLSDSDTFYELRDALDYAQELLGKGLSVRMECENAGGRLEITPDEYDEFVQTSDGAIFEDMPEVAEWLHQVQVERMDSYQEPWLDNWQYNTDIGMSVKCSIDSEYNTEILAEVDDYIVNNYPLWVTTDWVIYNGPDDWSVAVFADDRMVLDDFIYFFNENNTYISDRLKTAGILTDALSGNDFKFELYPYQGQWTAPQINVDGEVLEEYGDTGELYSEILTQRANFEAMYINALQDVNEHIGEFLKSYDSGSDVETSIDINAAIEKGNKTDYASNPIYELDKYVKDLAEGVAAAAGITLTYQISDEAITFIDGDGTAVFIQPISEITPEPDDLEDDIQQLVSAIQYEDMDNPEYWPTDTSEDDPDYATRAVQMSVDDDLEPVMGEGEDIGFGVDSYGETIDESTVSELYRIAEKEILPNTELAQIDPYVSIDEDSWDFYFGGVSNTGMMGVVKFYIHFKLTSDNIDLNEYVLPDAKLYPDFNYYKASLDFDIYTENGKVTDVVLESADIYKSDNSYDNHFSGKFGEAFNTEALENYIEKLAAPAVEEIYNAVSNL